MPRATAEIPCKDEAVHQEDRHHHQHDTVPGRHQERDHHHLLSRGNVEPKEEGTDKLPDVSTELAGLSGAQTFDGDKTFAGELTASGPVASIGTAPDTATYGLGTGATAAAETKTVNLGTGGVAGSDTVVNIGSEVAGADGTTVVNTPTVTFANGVTVVGMPQANLTALLLGLGGAVADAWNRLSVNTPAVLLNHAGAGIDATVNKNAAGRDYDWPGRAARAQAVFAEISAAANASATRLGVQPAVKPVADELT